METYYQVTSKDIRGVTKTQKRDTVERAYFIYKPLEKEFALGGKLLGVKLEEISASGVALLRALGCYVRN